MSHEVDLEKLRSIGHVGKTAGMRRIRQLDREGRSFEIDAPDGSVAGVVRPQPVEATLSVKEVSGG